MRKFLAFGLPLVLLLALAIALLAVSYQLSLPLATPTTMPTSTVASTGTQTPTLTIITTPSPSSEATSTPPRDFFRDVFLVLASGLITLSGYFVSAYIQSMEKDKEEIRERRKTHTKEYREYLNWLLSVGQHSMIVAENSVLKDVLPEKGSKFVIDGSKLEEVVEKLPPAWEFSRLGDDGLTKNALDLAISQGIQFITDLYAGQEPDYRTISVTYQSAIEALDRYEKYG